MSKLTSSLACSLAAATATVCLVLASLASASRLVGFTVGSHQSSNRSGCFELLQGGRLIYREAGGFNGTNAVISLRFLSFNSEGVLLYMGGPHGDFMGLFLRDGRINYFIFNPSRLDKSFRGIHFRGESEIELNRNYLVEFSFNQVQHQTVLNRDLYSTALRLDEATVQLLDYYIPDVQFQSPMFFGGGPSGLDLHVLDFEGRLTDIRINGRQLDSIETNHRVSRC